MNVFLNYEHSIDGLEDLPIEQLARFVMQRQEKPEDCEVSITFVDDAAMAQMNADYRGKQGPTDVLSFECDNLDDEFACPNDSGHTYELGDIVIAPDVALRQTLEFGTTLEEELSLLVVHGLLHLCGYDHIEDDEAEAMEARERVLLDAWAARS